MKLETIILALLSLVVTTLAGDAEMKQLLAGTWHSGSRLGCDLAVVRRPVASIGWPTMSPTARMCGTLVSWRSAGMNPRTGGDSAARGMALGIILGAAHGYRAIPERWIEGLLARSRVESYLKTMELGRE